MGTQGGGAALSGQSSQVSVLGTGKAVLIHTGAGVRSGQPLALVGWSWSVGACVWLLEFCALSA